MIWAFLGWLGWCRGEPCDIDTCTACAKRRAQFLDEIAFWFYCEGCHESYPLGDEEGGAGLCGPCARDAELDARGCYWCGPGVPATHTDRDGHDVCLGCSLDEDDGFDDSGGSPEDDSDYSDE